MKRFALLYGLKSAHSLGLFPVFVDALLMAGSIRTDFLRLVHRNREVHAEVTIKVVVPEMIGRMRHIVRGAQIGLAVREGDPNRLSRPGDLTGESFEAFAQKGFAPLAPGYRSRCVNLGRAVTFDGGRGVAQTVDDEGRLVVRTEEGDTAVFTGEVSVKGIYGALE